MRLGPCDVVGLIGAGGAGGRPAPLPRVTIASSDTAISTATPDSAGVAYMILAVTDNGTPSLSRYQRLVITIGSTR